MAEWHLITCEYPPKVGGVGDYAFVMARELAGAGDQVHVWSGIASGEAPASPGVLIHAELGRFSPRDLRRAGMLLDQFPGPRRMFVQWVPHGYGYRSMNIFFCLWLWMRARLKRDHVEIMFHEVWLSFGGSWKINLAASVHRLMVRLLKNAAYKIWIPGESWRKYLQGASAPIGWLPVPSNIPSNPPAEQIACIRTLYKNENTGYLIGNFGIGDALVEKMLRHFIPALLQGRSDASFLLMGKSSQKFAHELRTLHPDLGDRIFHTGILRSDEAAAHLCACDLMVQPYIDGISARRTGSMAVLANGRPLLTTSGHSTEQLWFDCASIVMVSADDHAALVAEAHKLLSDDDARLRVAIAGRKLYETLFDVSLSVQVLRGTHQSVDADRLRSLLLKVKS